MRTHSDITHNHTQWLMEDTLAVGAEYTSLCSSSNSPHTVVRPNTHPRTHPADGVRSAISTLVSCGVCSATVPRCTVQRTHALADALHRTSLRVVSVPSAVGVLCCGCTTHCSCTPRYRCCCCVVAHHEYTSAYSCPVPTRTQDLSRYAHASVHTARATLLLCSIRYS